MAKKGPRQAPRADRFWARVDRSEASECWPWTGVRNVRRGGYGYFYDDDQRLRRAHRVAWELTHGGLEDGVVIRHRCDNPPCCNPSHMELGTQTENMADMYIRGRGRPGCNEAGEARYNARLTDERVRWLRSPAAEAHSDTSIAREWGISRTAVSSARRGKSWRHVV